MVANTAQTIVTAAVPPDARADLAARVTRAIAFQKELLGDLLELSRLKAGQEPRRVAEFDAAAVLQNLADCSQPLAHERGLDLRAEGPAALPVEGDAVKVRRIAQNLVLNALAYAGKGTVVVAWEACPGAKRWALCVRDTGPGLLRTTENPLGHALREAFAHAEALRRT